MKYTCAFENSCNALINAAAHTSQRRDSNAVELQSSYQRGLTSGASPACSEQDLKLAFSDCTLAWVDAKAVAPVPLARRPKYRKDGSWVTRSVSKYRYQHRSDPENNLQ